eukprot:TRINITY_DN70749_c0_g1_i1.p1 TRINITY_DN70749_c0_g1~~TRINITY_DN70749_c0_g1_i1.p1  ORF type:complete len:626 (-),score=115.09 TRINITY_DN70749_c0_g1_i1:83-1960(-)
MLAGAQRQVFDDRSRALVRPCSEGSSRQSRSCSSLLHVGERRGSRGSPLAGGAQALKISSLRRGAIDVSSQADHTGPIGGYRTFPTENSAKGFVVSSGFENGMCKRQPETLDFRLASAMASHRNTGRQSSLPRVTPSGSTKGKSAIDHDLPEAPEDAHETLIGRLKSLKARQEAESLRHFAESYRNTWLEDKESDARLDRQLKATEKKAEELKLTSEKLREEVFEAERNCERCSNAAKTRRGNSSVNLQAMSTFERSQYLIQKDKREEELKIQADEAREELSRLHRKLQSLQSDHRDYKVLLGEYRRVKLEKLQQTLGRVTDGRKLRSIVREMIRQGAQKLLQRLEATVISLEPWMCEVLVNCCHLEIRMEDVEERLRPLRQEALHLVHSQVERMVQQPMDRRFDMLCAWTWDSLHDFPEEANPWRRPQPPPRSASSMQRSRPTMKVNRERDFHAQLLLKQMRESRSLGEELGAAKEEEQGLPTTPSLCDESQSCVEANSPSAGGNSTESPQAKATKTSWPNVENSETLRHREDFAADKPEVRTAEAELLALRRLLEDTRMNAASTICNRIQQSEKGNLQVSDEHRMGESSAMAWGKQVLTLLVSEDFAKDATKQLRKGQSQLGA